MTTRMSEFGFPSPTLWPLCMVRTSVVVIGIGSDRYLPLFLSITGGGGPSTRDFRNVESSLRERFRGVINLTKAKEAVRGFVSNPRRYHTEFTFDWLMNLKEFETALVYIIRFGIGMDFSMPSLWKRQWTRPW